MSEPFLNRLAVIADMLKSPYPLTVEEGLTLLTELLQEYPDDPYLIDEVSSLAKDCPDVELKIMKNIECLQEKKESPTVFISYSHKDEIEKDKLLSHLGVLRRAGLIDLWNDDQIPGGSDWEDTINKMMNKSSLAVLLITDNFLNSEFILGKEVPALLQRREKEGISVFPIIARACAWNQVEWLAKMNVRPKNGQPVWSNNGTHVDEDLASIAEEIANILKAKQH